MKKLNLFKNSNLYCILLSALAGGFTGILIFLFKISANFIIDLSGKAYGSVGGSPFYITLLILGVALLGVLSALLVKYLGNCRGGGIPTSIAILRGLIEFRWLRNIFAVWCSALISFLGGIPLGNEGPSVQIGTAVGRGTVRLFSKKDSGFDRYIMTGGACAGFGAATASPLTAIFFAFEEAHKRFSPLIFITAAVSVVSGSASMKLLCTLTDTDYEFFHFSLNNVLPLKYVWAAIITGLFCGLFAIFFTKVYNIIGNYINEKLINIPRTVKIVTVFVLVGFIGVLSRACIGSGHSLVDTMLECGGVWYLSIIYLLIRAIFLILANTTGITGGLFVPTLALGALLGSVSANLMIYLDILPREYYGILVVIGIVSFLSASSRTPISAITFSIEALSGFSNILPIAIGVTASYILIELVGASSFTESVVESKTKAENENKTPELIDALFAVKENSFAIGKEFRDILWPPYCVVTSVRKNGEHSSSIAAGDILHLHCRTFDFDRTVKKLEVLLGEQNKDFRQNTHSLSVGHEIPEI